jgi:hypothetical protein
MIFYLEIVPKMNFPYSYEFPFGSLLSACHYFHQIGGAVFKMENREEEIPKNVHPNKIKVADFLVTWAQTLRSEYFLNGAELHEGNFIEDDCLIPDEMVSELETLCGLVEFKFKLIISNFVLECRSK